MHLPDNTLLHGGTYRIIRFINSGGFGCTYEAEHVMLKKRVAIKEFFVKDFCNRDEQTAHVTVATQSKKGLVDKLRQKFIEEARTLSGFEHPNIVQVSDVFEENGTAYFVMKYIDGLSLNEIIQRFGPLPEEKALYYIRQVADALNYVHSRNCLHLDVKPGNILIDKNDCAILIDFGASKQYDEEDGENTSTLLGKTPGYAPLEQMGNDVVKFTPATDIYALGATLYKLLSGKTPLSATLLASDEELEPLPTSISGATRVAVEAAMKSSKKRRPQSIEDFLKIWASSSCSIKDEESICLEENTICEKDNQESSIRYIDLGLNVKWADCNIGAQVPEESGEYCTWDDALNFLMKDSKQTDLVLSNLKDDGCRLPTKEDFNELIEKCAWKWNQRNEKMGYEIIGPSGNTIFLPACGWLKDDICHENGTNGNYWSASPLMDNKRYVYALGFYENNFGVYWNLRINRQSLRLVKD